MNSRYRILFEVDFQHGYYREGKCNDFDITPSPATVEFLRNSRLMCKVVENKLLVLAKVDDDGKALPALPAKAKMVFYFGLANPEFLTVTNVDNSGLRSRRFYFSNLSQNQSGTVADPIFNLSKPIAAYDAGKTYLPGELAGLGAGTVFECIKTGVGQLPSSPGSTFWDSRGKDQSVSNGDLIALASAISEFTVGAAAGSFRIQTFGLDTSSNTYTNLVLEETVFVSATATTKTVQANLSSLAPGKYRVNINGEDFETYVDAEALAEGAFGVIEVFTHLPDGDAYALLDAVGAVKEIAYTLRFANRSAHWKYFTPLQKVQNILVSGDHALPSPFTAFSNDPAFPARKDYFLSNKPIPMTEIPGDNLFDLKIGSDFSIAPKPDPRAPGMITQSYDPVSKTYQDFFCNIHLNY